MAAQWGSAWHHIPSFSVLCDQFAVVVPAPFRRSDRLRAARSFLPLSSTIGGCHRARRQSVSLSAYFTRVDLRPAPSRELRGSAPFCSGHALSRRTIGLVRAADFGNIGERRRWIPQFLDHAERPVRLQDHGIDILDVSRAMPANVRFRNPRPSHRVPNELPVMHEQRRHGIDDYAHGAPSDDGP